MTRTSSESGSCSTSEAASSATGSRVGGHVRVLDLIETLWADPHVDQVPDTGWILFAWNEEGFDQVPDTGFGRRKSPARPEETWPVRA